MTDDKKDVKEQEEMDAEAFYAALASMSGSGEARSKGVCCSEDLKIKEYIKWDIITNGWEPNMIMRLFDVVNKAGGYAASLQFGGSRGGDAMSSLGALALLGGLS